MLCPPSHPCPYGLRIAPPRALESPRTPQAHTVEHEHYTTKSGRKQTSERWFYRFYRVRQQFFFLAVERCDPAPTETLTRPHERDGSGNLVGLFGVHGFSSRPVRLARGRPKINGFLHLTQRGVLANRLRARQPICHAARVWRGCRPPREGIPTAFPRSGDSTARGAGVLRSRDRRGSGGQRFRRLAGRSRDRPQAEPPVIPGWQQACPTRRALPTSQRSPAPVM